MVVAILTTSRTGCRPKKKKKERRINFRLFLCHLTISEQKKNCLYCYWYLAWHQCCLVGKITNHSIWRRQRSISGWIGDVNCLRWQEDLISLEFGFEISVKFWRIRLLILLSFGNIFSSRQSYYENGPWAYLGCTQKETFKFVDTFSWTELNTKNQLNNRKKYAEIWKRSRVQKFGECCFSNFNRIVVFFKGINLTHPPFRSM